MLMSILKTAKNLLRKILSQPGFEPGFALVWTCTGLSLFKI